MAAELFHEDRGKDRHDKANSSFSQFYKKRLTRNVKKDLKNVDSHQQILSQQPHH